MDIVSFDGLRVQYIEYGASAPWYQQAQRSNPGVTQNDTQEVPVALSAHHWATRPGRLCATILWMQELDAAVLPEVNPLVDSTFGLNPITCCQFMDILTSTYLHSAAVAVTWTSVLSSDSRRTRASATSDPSASPLQYNAVQCCTTLQYNIAVYRSTTKYSSAAQSMQYTAIQHSTAAQCSTMPSSTAPQRQYRPTHDDVFDCTLRAKPPLTWYAQKVEGVVLIWIPCLISFSCPYS
jgi:hypothetical protein